MEQPSFAFDEGAAKASGETPRSPLPSPLPPGAPGAPEAVEEPTLTVSALAGSIRAVLRDGFPQEIWVRGEVQGMKRSSNGHTYFSLVERDGERQRSRATIDVVLFRDDRSTINRQLKEVPGATFADDIEVRIRARVSMYEATGRLHLTMTAVDPMFTVGSLAANRERVLRGLAADGLLDRNRALTLAPVPLRVGLVTSAGSAAYHDFVDELTRSGYAFRVGLVNVRVQGASSAAHVVRALNELARASVDVVVLVRGGGSRADLAAFDADRVARAVATMPVPVFTGIGHEIDRSVVDEVAQESHKTPTACAQALVARVRAFVDRLDDVAHRVSACARARGALAQREIDEAGRLLLRSAPQVLVRERGRLDRVHGRAEELGRLRTRDASRQLATAATRVGERASRRMEIATASLDAAEQTVVATAQHHVVRAQLTVDSVEARVRALDPRRVLERGYTITRVRGANGEDRVVKQSSGVRGGDVLTTEFADGAVRSTVDDERGQSDERDESGDT